ncbi:hypothetical protein [Hydrogenophaga sp.]|jgi:hypothetical protein|uniref:hypothetical protein n=1 Tax=Hydrogenophaga sp. TaxID=1904254 RepID=UPI00271668DE|nr:hypothetical protein [Hydrogenophaga sp.]MDO9253107.1 hypothetical protein [Hydrogenophaga sp.]MDP3322180.1 hypothetical protein [Hydrogenophaga sp.]MDP3886001.1 hypothetical protein [Hydrogenophaga sp.]
MKYVALTLTTAATALLVLAMAGIAQQIGGNSRPMPPLQVSLSPLSEQQMREQDEVKNALVALRGAAAGRPYGLAQIGRTPAAPVDQGVQAQADYGSIFALPLEVAAARPVKASPRPERVALSAVPLPRVSVVLRDGSEGKAVVDGYLVGVGDQVAGGLVVKSIRIESVTFSARGEEIDVAVPLERLRVLGAFPSRSKGN